MRIGIHKTLGKTDAVHDLTYMAVKCLFVAGLILALNQKRLRDGLADGHAGVDGCKRVLEDDLHVLTQLLHLLLAACGDVLAIKNHLAVGRLMQAKDGTSQRGLAAARFANNAERFTLCEGKVDVIYGMELTGSSLKILFQVFNTQNGLLRCAHFCSPPALVFSARKQRTRCPFPTSIISGCSSRQRSVAY